MARQREIPPPKAPQELLEREGAWRKRAGVAAVAAGLLSVAAFIVVGLVDSGKPPVFLAEGLLDTAGKAIGREGLLTEQLSFLDGRAFGLIAATLLNALSALATGILLVYLFDAARGRRPETPAFLRSLTLAAVTAFAIGLIVVQVSHAIRIHDFLDGNDQSSAAAHDANKPSGAQYLAVFGSLGFGFAWALIALHAMRAGLLTRFLGILGIFSGVLTVFPLVQLPVIQFFWLVAVGLTIVGLAPQGRPPAWSSGVAEPWPTQQQLREERARASGRGEGEEGGSAAPSPAASGRKRRKRRT